MAAIQKVSYSHEAIILWLLENPHRPLRDCAAYFGYTQPWLSTVIHSDAFQTQLKARQDEMMIVTGQDIREKVRVATDIALEGLTRKLSESEDGDFFLDATDKLLGKMGYGQNKNPAPLVVNNIVSVTRNDLAEARAKMIGNGKIPDDEYPPREQSLLPSS
jgi:hypothetical protein